MRLESSLTPTFKALEEKNDYESELQQYIPQLSARHESYKGGKTSFYDYQRHM